MIKVPKHLAIILDGNRRWSKIHGVPIENCYLHAIRKAEEIALDWYKQFKQECGIKPFKQLTIYAYSLNNINFRSFKEVLNGYKNIESELANLDIKKRVMEAGLRLKFGGSLSRLPSEIHEGINGLEKLTESNDEYSCFVAIAYDGQEEIRQAVMIDAFNFEKHLYFPEAYPIDMMIRTGGEQRLSGFMLWYVGQAELFFTKTLAEDFSYGEFIKMMIEYSARDRRFGK